MILLKKRVQVNWNEIPNPRLRKIAGQGVKGTLELSEMAGVALHSKETRELESFWGWKNSILSPKSPLPWLDVGLVLSEPIAAYNNTSKCNWHPFQLPAGNYRKQAGFLGFLRPTLPKKYDFLNGHKENINKIKWKNHAKISVEFETTCSLSIVIWSNDLERHSALLQTKSR